MQYEIMFKTTFLSPHNQKKFNRYKRPHKNSKRAYNAQNDNNMKSSDKCEKNKKKTTNAP